MALQYDRTDRIRSGASETSSAGRPVQSRGGVPDYRAIARQLVQLSAEAQRHAKATGSGHYDRLARNLNSCAGAILDELDRRRR